MRSTAAAVIEAVARACERPVAWARTPSGTATPAPTVRSHLVEAATGRAGHAEPVAASVAGGEAQNASDGSRVKGVASDDFDVVLAYEHDPVGEVNTGAPDPRDTGLALRDGRLWVANLGGTVGVVDLAARELVTRAATGEGEPAALILDDRWAWVPTHGPGGGLVRLDRSDPLLAPLTVTLPARGFAAAADGIVWVGGLDRRPFAVDTETGTVERSIDVGRAPRGIAVAGGDVWVSLRDERAVARIDATTGEQIARIDTGGEPWPIAGGRATVWVATLDGRLLRIDTATNTVTARAAVGTDARGVAVTDRAVWVTSQSGSVTRVAAG